MTVDLRVRVDGPATAPVLVLSNSLGTTADMWSAQLPSLVQRFRVVRYEHRGHGGTTSPTAPFSIADLGGDIVAILDDLGVQTASLLGLSLGGTVAMWVAANHPDRVDSLVAACTSSHWPPAELWSERIELVRRTGTEALLPALLGRWFSPGFTERRPDAADMVASMLASASPEGYAGCCAALAEVDLRPDLGRISAPTLVLAGAEDPAVPIETAAALAASIPGASLNVIAGGAHLVNIERPERFTAAVVDHLAGDPVERGDRTRREVLGDAHVERSEEALNGFTAPFFDFITRYAWGDVWTRPGLDRRTRSCITLAMLVALGRFDELSLHVRAALRNGLLPGEIGEVLLQAAVYCGVPAANSAFAVANRVIEEPDGGR